MKTYRIFLCSAVLASLSVTALLLNAATSADSGASKWTAPATEMSKKNPLSASQGSIAAGQKIYTRRCAGCHGSSGNGDGPDAADLGIHPAKLSQLGSDETDGSLFWKISTGKTPMPGYGGKRLSETDRWNVINYLRTLTKLR